MKKELDYFKIGNSYGGSQAWFLDPWMHIGGCGALTMCDFLLYMACCKGKKDFYPYNIDKLNRRDYRRFGMSMKPYLRPRESGIKDLKTFVDGAFVYLEDSEIEGITLESLDGNRSYEEAESAVKNSVDSDMPVAMLMLKNQNSELNFFEWHWFLIIGYEDGNDRTDDNFMIKVATYGKEHWLPLRDMWESGEEEKGGLVLFREQDPEQFGEQDPEQTGEI